MLVECVKMCFKKGDEGGQKPEYWSQYVAVLTGMYRILKL